MNTLQFKRVPASGQYVSLASRCQGCTGCVAPDRQVDLPLEDDEVTLELSSGNQRSLLWNSLLKPLMLMLAAVVLCDVIGAKEAVAVLAATTGFLMGLLFCTPFSWQLVSWQRKNISGDISC